MNNKTKIKVRHNSSACNNYEFEVLPIHFTSKVKPTGCPICAGNKKLNEEEYIQKINRIHGENNYTLLSNYNGSNSYIRVRHNCGKCNNYEFEVLPTNFTRTKNASKCPKCYKSEAKSIDQLKEEIDILGNKEYELLTNSYKNNKTDIQLLHKVCNNTYYVAPVEFTSGGRRCPFCKGTGNSKGVARIKDFLNKNNVSYVLEKKFDDCKNVNSLPFDFFLPDYNLLIEFDGEFHWRGYNNNLDSLQKQKHNDNLKNIWARETKIDLLRISYLDIDRIELILENVIGENRLEDSNFNIYYVHEEKLYVNGIYTQGEIE